MATSGTVSTTVIDTALVIDHAVRRCKVSPSSLKPEDLDMARNNLYLILSSITNRGVNLWCVKRLLVALYPNQKSYTLPLGTIDVLDAQYRTPTALSYTGASSTLAYTLTFAAANAVVTCGATFPVSATVNLVYETSNDGVNWKQVAAGGSVPVVAGQTVWVDIDPSVVATQFRIRETVAASLNVSNVVVSAANYEIPVERYSRDQYEALTNKDFVSRPLNYLYDKQLTPVMTMWPVPNDPASLLSVKVQRMVQDVGSLSQKLEIPERWFEAIIWMLSRNLSFELPNVDDSRLTLCAQMADKYLQEAEDGETDSAPIFIAPNIRGYTT